MTKRFEEEKARLGRDWTDYSVLPLESNWLCEELTEDETVVESMIVFSTEDMQFHVERFLGDKSKLENCIYCIPISEETTEQIMSIGRD